MLYIDIEEYYANFSSTAILYFEIKSSRCTGESGSMLNLFCIHKFHASGGMRDKLFNDDACRAKWSNEELCTCCCRTTLFRSYPITWKQKHKAHTSSGKRDVACDGATEELAVAAVKVRFLSITLLFRSLSLSDSRARVGLAIIGRVQEKMGIIARVKGRKKRF